jgi:hypothetical protein
MKSHQRSASRPDAAAGREAKGSYPKGKKRCVADAQGIPSKGVVTGIETVCEKVGISFPDLHLLASREFNEWRWRLGISGRA